MEEFLTDEDLAGRLRDARDELQTISRRASTVAERLDETARLLGPEPDPDPRPEPEFPVRRSRHKQDRLPI